MSANGSTWTWSARGSSVFKFDTSALVDSIKQQVDGINDAVGEESLRAAGFAGADVFRDEAVLNAAANRKTGVLQNNIIVKRLDEESSETRQAYLVTVRSGDYGADGDAFYWRFVEFGHSNIRRRKNKRDTLTKRRAEALEFGTSRTPAYPFMRPAFESKKQEAADAMSAALSEEIKKKLGG